MSNAHALCALAHMTIDCVESYLLLLCGACLGTTAAAKACSWYILLLFVTYLQLAQSISRLHCTCHAACLLLCLLTVHSCRCSYLVDTKSCSSNLLYSL